MATTSPDGLRTPDPGDPYNLVPDLQTLANDTQDALILRANAYPGSVSDRTSFTPPQDGILWQDTDGIGMIWKSVSGAWVPALWHWSGTTTQMNSFAAPNGFTWTNTTDDSEYVRLGGVWRIRRQYANDVLVKTSAAANVSYSQVITFPQAFPITPSLLVSPAAPTTEGLPYVVASNISAAGFTVHMSHNFATRTLRFNWRATW